MITISTLFSGGEGVGVGARVSGLDHLWGVEYDSDIARVARDNGFNTITANVLDIDPHTMTRPDILHASPVCTNASVANSDGEEAQLDIDTATKTGDFIRVLKPDWFTLENVYPYRNFKSFEIITNALTEAGYSWDYWHLNSADYGVPQTRRRLILIAKLGVGQHIQRPRPTHHNPADYDPGQLMMFAPVTLPWVGWYEAIEDLIPTLPESEFAPWQLKRLPGKVKTFAINPNRTSADWVSENDATAGDNPFFTVTSAGLSKCRAFLVGDGDNYRPVDNGPQPPPTVSSSNGARALLVPGDNASNNFDTYTKNGTASANAVTNTGSVGNLPRAWLSSGRVVKMTPRALARFQSFPDWYKLPDKNSLAVKVIGNAVPPLLYQQIATIILEAQMSLIYEEIVLLQGQIQNLSLQLTELQLAEGKPELMRITDLARQISQKENRLADLMSDPEPECWFDDQRIKTRPLYWGDDEALL